MPTMCSRRRASRPSVASACIRTPTQGRSSTLEKTTRRSGTDTPTSSSRRHPRDRLPPSPSCSRIRSRCASTRAALQPTVSTSASCCPPPRCPVLASDSTSTLNSRAFPSSCTRNTPRNMQTDSSMGASPTVVRVADDDQPGRSSPRQWHAVLVAVRFVLAVIVSVAVCRLIWQFVPDKLSAHDGVLGYPVFADFDITRYYDAYFLLVIALPLFAIVAYHFLGRVRPKPRADRGAVFPLALDTTETERDTPTSQGVSSLVWAIVRAALPALVVALEVSVIGSERTHDVTAVGILAGSAYLVVALALGL